MSMRIEAPPPPIEAEFDGSGDGFGWVELARASDDIDAHLLTGRLNESGIETLMVKDRSALGSWMFIGGANPWAPVSVMVRPLQLEDARVVLAEISWGAPAMDPQRNPARPRAWRTPVIWWATALGLGVLLSSLALAQAAQSFPACEALPFCSEAEARP
jgi:Putative prokaryotic signal transducing protein